MRAAEAGTGRLRAVNSSRTTLLTGGRIHSPSAPDATAMAVEGGTVTWLGQDRPGRALHPDAEEIPLDGAFVAPSFVDAHVHATATGLYLSGPDLATVGGADELLEAVRGWCAAASAGDVLLAHGWDEETWSSSRLPSRAELDEACGAVPVYLSRIDVHSALVSSALAALAPGASDAAGWTADGPVTSEAHHLLRGAAQAAVPAEQRRLAQRTFLDAAAAAGITSVHECAGPTISGEDDLRELVELASATRRPDVVPYWGEFAGSTGADAVRRARELGVAGLAGDLCVDGALGSRTAALHEHYADPGEHSAGSRGIRYLDAAEVAAHVITCTEEGMQAGFHAIGDRAVSTVIEGFGAAERALGQRALAARSHRVEHLEMVDEEQAAQLARWNVTASMQPAFDAMWGGAEGMYQRRLGRDRARGLNPFSMLAARGVALAYGSDSPVTPLAPWQAVRAAVHHHTPGAGVSPRAAFNAHTRGGYRASGLFDGLSGRLVPGAPANYAVWDVGELSVAAPDARVQRWSTDPRSRVPPLPRVDPDAPLPRCLRTVLRGETLFGPS
ncbi:amidohydrolase [Haloechinothrix sp. YIM 98757]|uniref:Amidohydrolase n=1 Tax=Haloechinothrix aidingensis TaxID=2752311 RepID=A0A838A8Q3_9PSEU|nr:amidohydrolase [Haloechinothrix aidingensis]